MFENETKPGGMVRVGFKAGHFVLGVEYNAVPNSSASAFLSTLSSSSTKLDSKNSYLGIKLGADIGGGRR